ncbi:MAG: hypothetical protein ABW182_07415 [Sphingomonas sp.]
MAYLADERGRFEISTVISRTFDSIGANAPLYLGASFLLAGGPPFAAIWWSRQAALVTPYGIPDYSRFDFWLPYLIIGAVGLLTNAVLQIALSHATFRHHARQRVAAGEALGVGFSLMLPVVAIILVTWIASILISGITMVVLVLMLQSITALQAIPLVVFTIILIAGVLALLLWIRWSIAVPVYVLEREGLIEAFARSWVLTKGSGFRIFLAMLPFWIGAAVLALLQHFADQATLGMASPLIISLVVGTVNALVAVGGMTMLASVMLELRDTKEAVPDGDLTAIFA